MLTRLRPSKTIRGICLRVLVATLVLPVLLVTLSDRSAVAENATPHAICGYYETTSSAYYNHCGPRSVWVYIKYWGDLTTDKKCLSPGEHLLGPSEDVNYARSDGAAC